MKKSSDIIDFAVSRRSILPEVEVRCYRVRGSRFHRVSGLVQNPLCAEADYVKSK